MLAVSPLRDTTRDDLESQATAAFTTSISPGDFPHDDFMVDHGNLLDGIDFDDLFVGISDGEVFRDLEMEPEILGDLFCGDGREESERDTPSVSTAEKNENDSSGDGGDGEDKRDEESADVGVAKTVSKGKNNNKGKKSSSAQGKNKDDANKQGKRKVKVDWTPELHRRFVQAVEQLGVDKAVPSRILELMGIDSLTRHNVASHLQKYRSHRKHLLVREAEAASWSQRRHMYGATVAAGAGGVGKKSWVAPTLGYPPMTPMHHHHHHFRPLHVWGHPTIDQSAMNTWPKHIPHSPSPPAPQPVGHPLWTAPPPPCNPSYWHQPAPNGLTPGTPIYPQQLAAPTGYGAPPVQGIPPPNHPGIGLQAGQSSSPPPFDLHPSTESIDEAIGDVLSKSWRPLPLGLKPPSLDGVMAELQRQGISKVPPPPSPCA